jgi:O-antigen/teichoic acid export membrane protein
LTAHESSARALRGVPWTLVAYAFSRGTTVLGTLVLAHLLDPSDFGVVMSGMVVIFALNILSEGGFGGSLVVREDVDDTVLGTILVCMLGTACLAAALCAAAAPLIADIFGAPRLVEVMPFLALTIIPSTLGYFYIGLLLREMHFDRRFWGQLAMAVVYVAVAVPAALFGAGMWSLVAGIAAGQVAFALVLFSLSTSRPRPNFAPTRLRETFRHARGFIAGTLTEFGGNNVHFVAVSSTLGSAAMGVYSMAYRFTELPALALARPIAEATFPAVARMRDAREHRGAMLITSLTYLSLIGLPLLAGIAALAPVFVTTLLGQEWAAMAPPLQVLAAWGVAAMIAAALRLFVAGTGNPGWIAKIGLVRLLVTTPLLFAGVAAFESTVVVAVIITVDVSVEVAVILWYARRNLDVDTRALVRALDGIVLAAVGCGLAALVVRLSTAGAGASSAAQLVLGALAGAVAYCLLIGLLERDLLVRGVALLRRATSSRRAEPVGTT